MGALEKKSGKIFECPKGLCEAASEFCERGGNLIYARFVVRRRRREIKNLLCQNSAIRLLPRLLAAAAVVEV